MNQLEVPYIDSLDKESSLQKISSELDNFKKNAIDNVPWSDFKYTPEVSFAIAYNDCIFIKYFVREKYIRAVYNKTNDPVYLDSCVEFFICFDNEPEYYNMEFNCIGTCLVGFRTGRTDKQMLPEKNINTIKRLAVIKRGGDEKSGESWELTIMIPLEAFAFHKLHSLKDKTCRANFYKCGDELPEPHYLAWNNIESRVPDFHLPEFFGEIHFR